MCIALKASVKSMNFNKSVSYGIGFHWYDDMENQWIWNYKGWYFQLRNMLLYLQQTLPWAKGIKDRKGKKVPSSSWQTGVKGKLRKMRQCDSWSIYKVSKEHVNGKLSRCQRACLGYVREVLTEGMTFE